MSTQHGNWRSFRPLQIILGVIYERTGRKDPAIRVYKMTLATRHAPEETTERLAALLGSKPTDEAASEYSSAVTRRLLITSSMCESYSAAPGIPDGIDTSP